jgi:uncharacterized protein
VADLERGPKHVTWAVQPQWLERALEGTEAGAGEPPGELEVELTKTGGEVMVRGRVRAHVTMPCARTLEQVPVEVESDVFLLLHPEKNPAAMARRPRRAEREATGKQRSGHKGTQAKARGGAWPDDPVLSDTDAARDTYSGEEIVLDAFVREFILLELPMVPTRKGLPSEEAPTIAGSSAEAPAERPVDPRLLPLAEIASRLRNKE